MIALAKSHNLSQSPEPQMGDNITYLAGFFADFNTMLCKAWSLQALERDLERCSRGRGKTALGSLLSAFHRDSADQKESESNFLQLE
jgi:hypothetical protein